MMSSTFNLTFLSIVARKLVSFLHLLQTSSLSPIRSSMVYALYFFPLVLPASLMGLVEGKGFLIHIPDKQ